jgi:hypothetical protein
MWITLYQQRKYDNLKNTKNKGFDPFSFPFFYLSNSKPKGG